MDHCSECGKPARFFAGTSTVCVTCAVFGNGLDEFGPYYDSGVRYVDEQEADMLAMEELSADALRTLYESRIDRATDCHDCQQVPCICPDSGEEDVT